MVDVPDPPVKLPNLCSPSKKKQRDTEDEDHGSSSAGGNNNSKTPPGAGSPLHSKTHHLFVKIPPQRTAKFERMVRRNRTLEHEVKVGEKRTTKGRARNTFDAFWRETK